MIIALVSAKVADGVDSVYADADGLWESDTFKTLNTSEDASVEIFKEKYNDWASGFIDVIPGVTLVDVTLESNNRTIFLNYQDAGTKENIADERVKTYRKVYRDITKTDIAESIDNIEQRAAVSPQSFSFFGIINSHDVLRTIISVITIRNAGS